MLQTNFPKPTSATLVWARIEALFIALGRVVIDGRGSRVRLSHGLHIAAFHRPHPAKEAKPYQVEDARAFLETIGITP